MNDEKKEAKSKTRSNLRNKNIIQIIQNEKKNGIVLLSYLKL